jgi:threonine dehydratase
MTDLARIQAAAARLSGHARVTPLLSAPALDALAGRRVWVKAECLQHTGSFKFRGAWAAVSALAPADRARGVIALSSGNHAQGVALAAARHGASALIVMPADAPAAKIDGTRALGAELLLYDRARDDRDAVAARAQGDRVMIRPFDDAEVIAGQGSVGLELAAQAQAEGITATEVAVCCGGGGLSSGIALALEPRTGFRVRTVEPAGFDDMARSLATGHPQRNPATTGSLCDAILTPAPGRLTLPILSRLAGPGLTVTDDQALHAMALAFRHLKLVLEPGGAVALAAALFHRDAFATPDVIAIASGGNVDAPVFAAALSRYSA